MAIKRDWTTTTPDSSYLYDMVRKPGRLKSEGSGLFMGGEIPLGLPIGRADKPSKKQAKFGISLGARIGIDLLNERQEPRFPALVSKTVPRSPGYNPSTPPGGGLSQTQEVLPGRTQVPQVPVQTLPRPPVMRRPVC